MNNYKFRDSLALWGVKLFNVILITLMFSLCWFIYYLPRTNTPFYFWGSVLLLVLYAFLYFILCKLYDGFVIDLSRISEIIYSQFLAYSITDLIIYIVICLLSSEIVNVLPGLLCLLGQILTSSVWAYLSHRWFFKSYESSPTAIIYQENDNNFQNLVNFHNLDKRFDICKILKIDKLLEDLDQLDGIRSVFITDVSSHKRNKILKYCIEKDINVYVIPRVSDVILKSAYCVHLFHLPIYKVNRYLGRPEYLFTKRLLDILVSLVLLIITLPITLITSICIKCYDGGPVLYKQVRLTKDGREFNILKFRSMRIDAEKDGVARLSSGKNDDRITPVGKVIRKYRIDELPQLLNILKGDLSLVGPRAERPEIHKKYCETFPEFNLRLQVKAGLTGYAQVYGKYNTTPYNKLKMDLMYIAYPNIIDDLKIVLATIKILFIPESTEGITEGQTTAMGSDGEK